METLRSVIPDKPEGCRSGTQSFFLDPDFRQDDK